jgi:hypothetical protein
MIIKICNTDYSNIRRLIDRYPELSKFGYHDEEISDIALGHGYTGKVIINSLEELVLLSKEIHSEIIVCAYPGCDPSLEIYDGWRE